MKRLVVLITFVLVVVNIVLGAILTAYHTTNVILNSVVILSTGILLWVLSSIHLKDAYKYSLSLLFSVFGFVEYVLGFFASFEWKNNWFVIVALIILSVEIISVLLTNYISNKNN